MLTAVSVEGLILDELRAIRALLERQAVSLMCMTRPQDLPQDAMDELTRAWHRVVLAAPLIESERRAAAAATSSSAPAPASADGASATSRPAHCAEAPAAAGAES